MMMHAYFFPETVVDSNHPFGDQTHSSLSFLASILFSTPQLFLISLLHINHQPGYVYVAIRIIYLTSFLDAQPKPARNMLILLFISLTISGS